MNDKTNLEFWLRGPLVNVPKLLQPVAHALLQAREEINKLLQNFPDHFLWNKPAGVASVALHLQHLYGVLDRPFIKTQDLVQAFSLQVNNAIDQLITEGWS